MAMKQSLEVSRQGNEGRQVVKEAGKSVSFAPVGKIRRGRKGLTYQQVGTRQAKEKTPNSGQMQRDDKKKERMKRRSLEAITGLDRRWSSVCRSIAACCTIRYSNVRISSCAEPLGAV